MANEILGAKNYLVLASEDVWGTNPYDGSGSGSAGQGYIHLPCDTYDVRFRAENRQATPYIGLLQRKHSNNYRGMPSGSLACSIYGYHDTEIGISLAQYLMNWAFENHESTELPSKTAQWAEGPNVANKQHGGLRVNSATLSGSDDGGIVGLSLDLMGKSEATFTTAKTLPNDREKLSEFEFADVTCSIGGSAVNIKSFSLQIQRGLQAHYLNSYTPSILLATQRVLTLQLELIKNSDTYDAYRRATTSTELVAQLVLKGLHNGTAADSYTKVTLDFPRCHLIDVDQNQQLSGLTTQPVNLICLKPDTSSNDMTTTWTTSAS